MFVQVGQQLLLPIVQYTRPHCRQIGQRQHVQHFQYFGRANLDGELLTPSAVYVAGDEAVVGQSALDVSLEDPASVATLVKRRMGQPDFGRPVAGKSFRPETLSAPPDVGGVTRPGLPILILESSEDDPWASPAATIVPET